MITSGRTIPVYKNGQGIHDVINELQKGATQLSFYEEHGFASCFECDETFTDLDELNKHQAEHLIKEQTLG
jgi:hypothetical protein|tara:strand:+ start:1075 stop:1287 length:213 start_codon:yes stop_codon:yes gene_type:complete